MRDSGRPDCGSGEPTVRKPSAGASTLDSVPEPSASILVVEDEPSLRAVLERALSFAGFAVATVPTVAAAWARLAEERPDLVVLDIMLPDGSGLDVGARLRVEHPDVAVVFLTARDSVDDRLTGFALGGDDYLTKPFSVAELVARVQAVLRRARPTPGEPELRVADLVIREHAHEVLRGDDVLALSPTEYRLLHHLVVNAGRVLSKQQLLDHVWQYDFGGDHGVVEKFVSQLRRKLDHGREPLLHTVRGFGYVVRAPRT